MNVTFDTQKKQLSQVQSNTENLKIMKIDYNCEWPLEIVLDK